MNELTEREKWLMLRAWIGAGYSASLQTFDDWLRSRVNTTRGTDITTEQLLLKELTRIGLSEHD